MRRGRGLRGVDSTRHQAFARPNKLIKLHISKPLNQKDRKIVVETRRYKSDKRARHHRRFKRWEGETGEVGRLGTTITGAIASFMRVVKYGFVEFEASK